MSTSLQINSSAHLLLISALSNIWYFAYNRCSAVPLNRRHVNFNRWLWRSNYRAVIFGVRAECLVFTSVLHTLLRLLRLNENNKTKLCKQSIVGTFHFVNSDSLHRIVANSKYYISGDNNRIYIQLPFCKTFAPRRRIARTWSPGWHFNSES